jgi:HSP20 family protein
MIQPMTPNTWRRSLDLPARLFGEGGVDGSDYELYEEEDAFLLTVELPGFERDEITLTWDDGVLNVAAEHVDESRGRERTYSRRFRLPKDVDEDAIEATYRNGVLEVRLPIAEAPHLRGREIPIED